jgi:hypothetical protein
MMSALLLRQRAVNSVHQTIFLSLRGRAPMIDEEAKINLTVCLMSKIWSLVCCFFVSFYVNVFDIYVLATRVKFRVN